MIERSPTPPTSTLSPNANTPQKPSVSKTPAPNPAKRNMITDDDLRAIEAEALVIWTTKDPSGPVDEGRRIASLIPRGRLEVIENCGHWPQYEDTATFNRFHLDFPAGL